MHTFSFDAGSPVQETTPTAQTVKVLPKRKFKATEEQVAIKDLVSTPDDVVKIEAIAGSGKSSTLVYVAEHNPVPSLLLVFNKSAKEEALEKQPRHVECLTTHGLAYRHVGNQYQHKLSRPVGRYVNVAGTPSEIAKYFKLPTQKLETGDITAAFLGLLVRDTVNTYQNSSDEELSSSHIPYYHLRDLIKKHGKEAVKKLKKLVTRYAESLWDERTDTFSQVLCTHDTYLKLYALSKPDLSKYKIIYCDEFQDTSDVVIDIVLRQRKTSKIVIVGDSRQAIYQWRNAVNALKKIEGATASLTKSFRYGEASAAVAKCILRNKVDMQGNEDIDTLVGLQDTVDTSKPYTLLFRTNMDLIFTAIEYIGKGENVSVNIDMKDFVNMVKSAEALYQGNLKQVKHENIVPYSNWGELEEEAKGDGELSRIFKIVSSGGSGKLIKTLHSYRNPPNAHITLTTAHKSKGLEYDQVILANDFPSNYNRKGEFVGLAEEEENLLYVAATRAIYALQYNQTVQECLDMNGYVEKAISTFSPEKASGGDLDKLAATVGILRLKGSDSTIDKLIDDTKSKGTSQLGLSKELTGNPEWESFKNNNDKQKEIDSRNSHFKDKLDSGDLTEADLQEWSAVEPWYDPDNDMWSNETDAQSVLRRLREDKGEDPAMSWQEVESNRAQDCRAEEANYLLQQYIES